MIVFFPFTLHEIAKCKKKRYDRSDRFYCCFRNRALPHCLGKFACMHIHVSARFRGPKNKNKNTERRAGLRFDRIHEKLNYPKRFTDNIEKKIKDDLYFIKTMGLGPWRFHCFTEFFTGP